MTLSRQLITLILALLVLVFVGTFYISMKNTQDYVQAQLESHAQDAATSLGLSITPHVEEGDLATVSAMVNAIFDSGAYQDLVIKDMQGKILEERRLGVKIAGVPEWFTTAFRLETPKGESLVMSGWTQAATIEIHSHPGFAYDRMWANFIETLTWFMLTGLVVVSLGLVALKLLLKPLKDVEDQAYAICNREFPILENIPHTREFRRIVEAMNQMADRLKRMFMEQDAMAQNLREQAYVDAVTGLANRRYFQAQLQQRLDVDEEVTFGVLGLLQLKDFKQYNDEKGYQAGDKLLKQLADFMVDASEGQGDPVLAHLSGADFAVLMTHIRPDDVESVAQELTRSVARLHEAGLVEKEDCGSVGLAVYSSGKSSGDLMSEADMALRAAQSKGANAWHLFESEELEQSDVQSATQWRAKLENVIEQGEIALRFQPALTNPDHAVMHNEVLARIKGDNGEWMPAGVFIPTAEGLGMTSALDKVILTKLLEHMRADTTDRSYTINLSASSLRDESFTQWVKQQMETQVDLAKRLILEWPEYGALGNMEALQALIGALHPFGVRFSLDHFGRGSGGFGYLQSIKLDVIKIDGSFIASVDSHLDNRFFLRSLTEIAHGLGMQVIAERVETEAEWQVLKELHVDGGQGFHLAKPSEQPV